MARILIAGATAESREKMSRLLASSGFRVFRLCASGSELRRAINACEDGVVVLLGGVADCTVQELQWDYGDRVQILLIARPEVLEACEAREVFRLALPSSSQAVLGAVEMLSQLHRMQLPRRSGDEKSLVDEAKRRLMAEEGLTEEEAHRAMQRYAMRHGMKMTEYAARLLSGAGGTAL